MGKNKNLIQIYAIIINVVAVITFIICVANLVSNLFDSMDPLLADRSAEHLSSFESFKMESMKSVDSEQAYLPTDKELNAMYESAKKNKIDRVMHGVKRDSVTNLIVLAISVVLFWTHYRLMRNMNTESGE